MILAACSGATSTPATSNSPTIASSVASADNAKGVSLTSCQTVRDAAPKQVEYDTWDSPGVITTDVEIDRYGNKFIAGYMTDENAFNYKDSFQTVGINGSGFAFISKFNPQSEFQWIRCLKETSLNHWYKGPTVDTDNDGNLYVCESTLERWDTLGNREWSSSELAWTSENVSDVTRNCSVSEDGFSIITSIDETNFVSPSGENLWTKNLGFYSAAVFLEDGKIALASNSSLMVINREGAVQWKLSRDQRNDIGPDGLIDGGTNAYSTDQTGLSVDDAGIVIVTSLNKKADFDGSEKVESIRPRWIQEAVVARYSFAGQLKWATKIRLPNVNSGSTQYQEIFDAKIGRNGNIYVFGGGTRDRVTEPTKLFLVKFSPSGEQLRLLWLDEYINFIHNLGRYIDIDSRGRVYGTMESLRLAPFLWSRDL